MDQAANSLLECDPTGTVNLHNPAAIEAAIGLILDRRYGGAYDRSLLQRGIDDLVRCYCGRYPGLMPCDTPYHGLRHALETGLTMARLIDGDCAAGGREGPPLDARQALLGIVLAFFHDVGLLRRGSETDIWGAQLLPIHEERGVEFLSAYLQTTSLAACADQAGLIMPTKLTFSIPADWTAEERKLASMIASVDLISQMADRCYLEKCRDYLFREFVAIGLAGTPDSPYPDAATLLSKTPGFVRGFARDRLDREFRGISRLMEAHFNGVDPYWDAISRHLDYLERQLLNGDLAGLRRRPQAFVDANAVDTGEHHE